jgi:hypothetical protein
VSRRDVRIALCRYFSGAQNPDPDDLHAWRGTAVDHLGVVYDAPPAEWPRAWAVPLGSPPGTPTGCMGTPRIVRSNETRYTGPRVAGIKRDSYDVVFDLFLTSSTGIVGDAVDDLEDLIETFTARLRADPTLGGAAFSAGEGDVSNRVGAASRIEWDTGFPATDHGITTIYAACKFGVVQHVTA